MMRARIPDTKPDERPLLSPSSLYSIYTHRWERNRKISSRHSIDGGSNYRNQTCKTFGTGNQDRGEGCEPKIDLATPGSHQHRSGAEWWQLLEPKTILPAVESRHCRKQYRRLRWTAIITQPAISSIPLLTEAKKKPYDSFMYIYLRRDVWLTQGHLKRTYIVISQWIETN